MLKRKKSVRWFFTKGLKTPEPYMSQLGTEEVQRGFPSSLGLITKSGNTSSTRGLLSDDRCLSALGQESRVT